MEAAADFVKATYEHAMKKIESTMAMDYTEMFAQNKPELPLTSGLTTRSAKTGAISFEDIVTALVSLIASTVKLQRRIRCAMYCLIGEEGVRYVRIYCFSARWYRMVLGLYLLRWCKTH